MLFGFEVTNDSGEELEVKSYSFLVDNERAHLSTNNDKGRPREGAPLGKKKARLWKFYGVASNSKILAIVPGICGCKVGVRISPAQSL